MASRSRTQCFEKQRPCRRSNWRWFRIWWTSGTAMPFTGYSKFEDSDLDRGRGLGRWLFSKHYGKKARKQFVWATRAILGLGKITSTDTESNWVESTSDLPQLIANISPTKLVPDTHNNGAYTHTSGIYDWHGVEWPYTNGRTQCILAVTPCWLQFTFQPNVLPGHSIQVLVSSQESAALHGLNEAVILIDIHEHSSSPPTLMMKAYTVQRLQNRLSLIQEAGLLVQCSTTHLCRIWRNGNACTLHYVAVEIADFINIQVKDKTLYGPAVDIFATAPRDAEEAESQHTEEPPEDDNVQTTEGDNADPNPAADYMVVIRRPRPAQITDSFHAYVGDREEEEAAAQARRRWPDLDGLEPTIKEVDASFYNSFLEEEAWVLYLAIHSVTFNAMPHMRAVIVLLRRFGEADYQAMALAHLTSELGILSRCRLLHECKVVKAHYCVTTHNGGRVFGSTRIEVQHGDFIRVDLIDKENVMQEVKLLSTTEEDYVRNDRVAFWPSNTLVRQREERQQGQTVATSSGIRTGVQTLHEYYWFTLTAMIWIFVPLLLRFHELEHPTPKQRKTRRKRSRTNIKTFRTILLCGLLISQHWHCALALQQQHPWRSE